MVSAIILNYLNAELTAKSVDHLLDAAESAHLPIEVIVVDNSAPQTAQELREVLPKAVKIIENEENRGFSAANNQGIKQAEGEIILIMNNDLFINEKVLKEGVEAITLDQSIGVWAPKLIDRFGNSQRSCANFPTLRGVVAEYLFKHQFDNSIALAVHNIDHPVEVDTVIGACMVIRKAVLREVDLFDEDYFFNSEDVDLCNKIKKRGYKVILDPRFEAVHLYSASQNSSWYEDPYLHSARKIYFKKHHNFIKALLARFCIDTGIALRKIKHKFD